MILNLGLIPDENTSSILIEESTDFESKFPSVYVLGKNSIPHCTLLQIETENITQVKKLLGELLEFEIEIVTKKHYMNLSEDENSWTGVEVTSSEKLIDIQRKALDLLNGNYIKIHNKTGEEYFPHFTLGMVPQKIDYKVPGSTKLTNKKIKCTLKLGLSGEHYTFSEFI